MLVLIMAGGSGTRFWPLSRESMPKQYLNIVGERTMLQLTVDRLSGRVRLEDVFIVTSAAQVELVRRDLPELPPGNIIVEPRGRNTAPCIALSVCQLLLREKRSRKETMLVLAADHRIEDTATFLSSLDQAELAAREGALVTFGIKPDYPATGYGYIEKGGAYRDGMFHVKQFREKPDLATAVQFLESGDFLWNSGMFLWELGVIFDALDEYRVIDSTWHDLANSSDYEGDVANLYDAVRPQPIDIAVMEKAKHRVVVPVDYGWSDVGGWRALYDISERDACGIACRGDYIAQDSRDTYVHSPKLVALLGVEGLVVVDTPDVLLVARKEDSEKVKQIIDRLREKKLTQYL
jgi:mannose-1-phosphate guanylyltransferase